MGDSTLTAVIAATAAIVSALVAGGATYAVQHRTGKLKIEELNLAYHQKMAENARSKARDYLEAIYLPIQISLSKLVDAFYTFEARGLDASGRPIPESRLAFVGACDEFLRHSEGLRAKGADAFLLPGLDTQLQSFSSFLKESRNATSVKHRISYRFGVRNFLPFGFPSEIANTTEGSGQRRWMPKRFEFDTWFIFGRYEFEETLCAPVESEDFKERLTRSVEVMKNHIKEVTLETTAS